MARWTSAYAYLAARTKPTQIVCSWFDGTAGRPSPAPRPALFYSFSARTAWKTHLFTRADRVPTGIFEACGVTVPTSVPYGAPGIESFLRRYGLAFVADPKRPAGTPVEIAYAGQNSSDPDIVFRNKPGLFGLRLALEQLGDSAFQPGSSEILPPTDDATAAEYLRYAAPLLAWYGFKG